MRNQAVRVLGGYRGEVTRDGRVVAATLGVFDNRNAAVIAAWRVLLSIRDQA